MMYLRSYKKGDRGLSARGTQKGFTPYHFFKKSDTGFTLIEMMVAVAIFSIVMLVAVGALLSIIDANRKARAVKSVVNNVSFAIESMARQARLGTRYHCRGAALKALDEPLNCSNGVFFAFEHQFGDPTDVSDQYVYRYNAGGKYIEFSRDGGNTFIPLTAPNQVRIERFRVDVHGAENTDGEQPRAVFRIRGVVHFNDRTETIFRLQTSVTQRILDQQSP